MKGTEVVAPRTERRGRFQGLCFKEVTRVCRRVGSGVREIGTTRMMGGGSPGGSAGCG